MKKLMTIIAGVFLAGAAFAQLALGNASSTLTVKPTLVRSFDSNDYRTGLAFETLQFNWRSGSVNRNVGSLDFWLLTDSNKTERLFAGAGLSYPMLVNRNLSLHATLGWSADFSNLNNPRQDEWGFGLNLRVRL